MITLDDIRNAEITDLTVNQRVEAFYKGTDAIRDFSEKVIVPVLRGQLGLKDRELAAIGTFYRMYAWVHSMVALNSRIHFQAAATAARSIFELQIDLRLLAADRDGPLVEQFHAFKEVERYRVARNIVEYVDQARCNLDVEPQRELVSRSGMRQHVDKLIVSNWGRTKAGKPRRPDHWSGLNLKDRVKKLGPKYEEKYYEVYPYLSWYTHPGSTAYAGLSEETLELGFGRCHGIAQQSMIDAMLALSEVIPLKAGIEDLRQILEFLENYPGKVIIEEQIEMLKKRKGIDTTPSDR